MQLSQPETDIDCQCRARRVGHHQVAPLKRRTRCGTPTAEGGGENGPDILLTRWHKCASCNTSNSASTICNAMKYLIQRLSRCWPPYRRRIHVEHFLECVQFHRPGRL